MTKKFRIWTNSLDFESGYFIYSQDRQFGFLGESVVIDGYGIVSSKKIEQFTGRLDATGKEIYEGDLVKAGAIKGIVNFEQGAFFVGDELLFNAYVLLAGKISVIGNIHENNT